MSSRVFPVLVAILLLAVIGFLQTNTNLNSGLEAAGFLRLKQASLNDENQADGFNVIITNAGNASATNEPLQQQVSAPNKPVQQNTQLAQAPDDPLQQQVKAAQALAPDQPLQQQVQAVEASGISKPFQQQQVQASQNRSGDGQKRKSPAGSKESMSRGAVILTRQRKPAKLTWHSSSNVTDPWPQAFYIGVPKAGSTSLFRLLLKHPRVCPPHMVGSPRRVEKEPSFFYLETLYKRGLSYYLRYFRDEPKCNSLRKQGQKGLFFDGSTRYIHRKEVPGRIKRAIPKELHERLRFVVIFREPVERDRSWRGQVFRNRRRELTDQVYLADLRERFKVVKAGGRDHDLHYGYYGQLLSAWWKEFDRDQFLVLNYETMKANETDTLTRIFKFLSLDLKPIEADLNLPEVNVDPNKKEKTDLAAMDLKLCKQLRDLYKPHVKELYHMLDTGGLSEWQPPFPRFEDPCVLETDEQPERRPTSGAGGRHRKLLAVGGSRLE